MTKASSPLFELALVLLHLDHVACVIVNADHGVVRADEKLTAFLETGIDDSGNVTRLADFIASLKPSDFPRRLLRIR